MSKKQLWQHQKYSIEKYKDRPYFGLLFDMGLGKTLTATRIAEAKERPVLIIAPNTLCGQWKEELTDKSDECITEKEWEVVVCTSKTKNTKRFKEEFSNLCKKE